MPDKAEIAVQIGGKKIMVTVGSNATRDEMLNTIADTINDDPDFLVRVFVDDGSICQSPVDDLQIRCEPCDYSEADLINLIHKRKGRRRGQRRRDFTRK